MSDDERLLPIPTAVAMLRAHLQHQQGQLSDEQLRDALKMELAAHEDLALVIEAQALLGAAILRTLEAVGPEGVTAESFLLGLERDPGD